MFCPVCQCEYRDGFTRCADCNVDLVEDLSTAPARTSPGTVRAASRCASEHGPHVDFCGFFSLDEARHARNTLWGNGVRSEIVIREAPGCDPGADLTEEFWLRLGSRAFPTAAAILGYDTAEGEALQCAVCGGEIPPGHGKCPACGVEVAG